MTVAMLFWPIVEALANVLSRPYSPVQIVWMRYGTHLLLMLVLWTPAGPARLLRTRRPGLHALRALTMLGMPACYVLATTRMPVVTVMSIFWVAPLLALGLAAVLLGDRPGPWRWLAAAAAYAGALLILGPWAVPRASAVLPLAMAGCFALYQVLTRAMREETTSTRLFYTALGVWLPLGLLLPWFWMTPTLRDLGVMMAIGVLGFLFLLGMDLALDAAPVSRVAPFALAQPIWEALLGPVVGGPAPGPAVIGGIAVVLAAWLVFAWPRRAGVPAGLH
jgi:drug/metabolite transporter (DMT)-like permease